MKLGKRLPASITPMALHNLDILRPQIFILGRIPLLLSGHFVLTPVEEDVSLKKIRTHYSTVPQFFDFELQQMASAT